MMCGKSLAHIQTSPHAFISTLKSAAQTKIDFLFFFSSKAAIAYPVLKLKGAAMCSASPGALSISGAQKAVLEDANLLSELITTISAEWNNVPPPQKCVFSLSLKK